MIRRLTLMACLGLLAGTSVAQPAPPSQTLPEPQPSPPAANPTQHAFERIEVQDYNAKVTLKNKETGKSKKYKVRIVTHILKEPEEGGRKVTALLVYQPEHKQATVIVRAGGPDCVKTTFLAYDKALEQLRDYPVLPGKERPGSPDVAWFKDLPQEPRSIGDTVKPAIAVEPPKFDKSPTVYDLANKAIGPCNILDPPFPTWVNLVQKSDVPEAQEKPQDDKTDTELMDILDARLEPLRESLHRRSTSIARAVTVLRREMDQTLGRVGLVEVVIVSVGVAFLTILSYGGLWGKVGRLTKEVQKVASLPTMVESFADELKWKIDEVKWNIKAMQKDQEARQRGDSLLPRRPLPSALDPERPMVMSDGYHWTARIPDQLSQLEYLLGSDPADARPVPGRPPPRDGVDPATRFDGVLAAAKRVVRDNAECRRRLEQHKTDEQREYLQRTEQKHRDMASKLENIAERLPEMLREELGKNNQAWKDWLAKLEEWDRQAEHENRQLKSERADVDGQIERAAAREREYRAMLIRRGELKDDHSDILEHVRYLLEEPAVYRSVRDILISLRSALNGTDFLGSGEIYAACDFGTLAQSLNEDFPFRLDDEAKSHTVPGSERVVVRIQHRWARIYSPVFRCVGLLQAYWGDDPAARLGLERFARAADDLRRALSPLRLVADSIALLEAPPQGMDLTGADSAVRRELARSRRFQEACRVAIAEKEWVIADVSVWGLSNERGEKLVATRVLAMDRGKLERLVRSL